MRILVLDDNEIIRRAPEDYFVDPHDYRNDEFVQTKDVKKFVGLFFSEKWDEVWIDHDLGLGHINGRTATKDILERIVYGEIPVSFETMTVLITTMNPSVANNMVTDLIGANLRVRALPISFLGGYGVSRGDFIRY